MAISAWDVSNEQTKRITTTVYFDESFTAEQVKAALVEHDGYDKRTVVTPHTVNPVFTAPEKHGRCFLTR